LLGAHREQGERNEPTGKTLTACSLQRCLLRCGKKTGIENAMPFSRGSFEIPGLDQTSSGDGDVREGRALGYLFKLYLPAKTRQGSYRKDWSTENTRNRLNGANMFWGIKYVRKGRLFMMS